MVKEANLNLNLIPEVGSGEYVFSFDNSSPVSDQILDFTHDRYLLNVRKVFTNGIYYGLSYTTLDKDKTILHHFKCKDNGLSEVEVENKETFLEFYKFWSSIIVRVNEEVKTHTVKQDFYLPYDVYFCFDDSQRYVYTTIQYDANNIFRGLYGTNSFSTYDRTLRETGTALFYKKLPTKQDVINFVDDKKISLSNVMHTISTEYSKIIVEHKTQYEQEWSDIKRRRNVKKSTNDE